MTVHVEMWRVAGVSVYNSSVSAACSRLVGIGDSVKQGFGAEITYTHSRFANRKAIRMPKQRMMVERKCIDFRWLPPNRHQFADILTGASHQQVALSQFGNHGAAGAATSVDTPPRTTTVRKGEEGGPERQVYGSTHPGTSGCIHLRGPQRCLRSTFLCALPVFSRSFALLMSVASSGSGLWAHRFVQHSQTICIPYLHPSAFRCLFPLLAYAHALRQQQKFCIGVLAKRVSQLHTMFDQLGGGLH